MTTQRLTAAAALHLGIPMTEPIDAKIARLTQMRIDGEDGYGNEPFRAALRAELAIPQEVTAPNLTPEMRESLNSRLSDHWYGCADEVWRLIWATTNTKHAQPIGGKVTQIKSTHRKLRQAVECLEILNQRPRPMCRDCGDSKVIGVCDNNGLACDMPTLIKDAKASLKALAATSTKPADSAAVQVEPVAWQEYDSVTRESAENAIEYMSSYNGRGREVDAQAMLVTTPPPPSIGGEVTDAEIGRIANSYGVDSIQGFDHIKAFARAIIAATSTKLADDDFDQALKERDRYHEAADELAARLATITGEDIGEHSSANCPWTSALNAADNFIAAKPADSAAVQVEPLVLDVYKSNDVADILIKAGWKDVADSQWAGLLEALPALQATLTPQAPTAQPVAPGWQLVPVEPTQEMLDYADKTVPTVFSIGDEYKAMLSAAPSMPPKEGV